MFPLGVLLSLPAEGSVELSGASVHGWAQTGAEVAECVSIKYSSLLIQFQLLLNTDHVQQLIHDEVWLEKNKQIREYRFFYSTQSQSVIFIKTESFCGHNKAVGSPSVDVMALAISLICAFASKFEGKKIQNNLYVLLT